MRAARWHQFGHRLGAIGLGAIAAPLIAATMTFGAPSDARAQNQQQDPRAHKKPPPKAAPVRPAFKGAVKGPVPLNRNVVVPGMRPGFRRGPMFGPGALPQNARTIPNGVNPRFRAPGAFVARDPRGFSKGLSAGPGLTKGLGPGLGPAGPNGRAASVGPGNRGFGGQSRIGNIQATRGLGLPGSRGFTNRDPRMRAVNAVTPQLRQGQRFTHRTEMFAVRARMPRFPLPGERNFTGIPPVNETRFVTAEMVCQWGPNMTQAGIEAIARRHN